MHFRESQYRHALRTHLCTYGTCTYIIFTENLLQGGREASPLGVDVRQETAWAVVSRQKTYQVESRVTERIYKISKLIFQKLNLDILLFMRGGQEKIGDPPPPPPKCGDIETTRHFVEDGVGQMLKGRFMFLYKASIPTRKCSRVFSADLGFFHLR
jgi:hypothetical protein